MLIDAFELGVERGDAHIASDLITNIFRGSTRGSAPKNSWILDGIYDFIGYVRTHTTYQSSSIAQLIFSYTVWNTHMASISR